MLTPSPNAEAEPNPDRKPPKVISPSDPCSAWTAKVNKRVQFGYGLNYLIDIENAVIVDVEPTPARTYDEVESTKIMLARTERRFHLKPKRLARISHTTECIGVANQRKPLRRNNSSSIRGAPRCRQSVAQISWI